MSARYLIGDVYERMAEIPDGSIDLVVTSPPFLALRSYLPADHPNKGREIGSEANPADFLDTLLALTAEWGRVLAPHGSICVELGDTFSGSTATGGDWSDSPATTKARVAGGSLESVPVRRGTQGWPLAKSLTGIPTLYAWSLAYGRNLLTGQESPAGRWRIRNLIVWARPNPPVGALGDKFRPATSYITVATRASDRWFDLDAVRTEHKDFGPRYSTTERDAPGQTIQRFNKIDENGERVQGNPSGAPPLDWHADEHPEDGDWLWKLPTQPYKGAHYATFPKTLPKRLIEAMCPREVCTGCGEPRRRITGDAEYHQSPNAHGSGRAPDDVAARTWTSGIASGRNQSADLRDGGVTRHAPTLGWTVCDCPEPTYRSGMVLDPFGGSGTTGAVATGLGRDCILIDLDERNADLARDRVGMFLEVEYPDDEQVPA